MDRKIDCRFLIFILLFIITFASASFSQELEDSISFIHNPQQLASWLSDEFIYEWEIGDDWQNPQEMISSGRGDCIDFAILASAILNHLEISNHILIIKFEDLKSKHAVCTWRDREGFYDFISNQKLFNTKKRTVKEAIGKFYPDWEKIIFTDEKRRHVRIIRKREYFTEWLKKTLKGIL